MFYASGMWTSLSKRTEFYGWDKHREENEIRFWKFLGERQSFIFNSIPSGLDELHIPFKYELMWLTYTHANIHTHFLRSDMAKTHHTPPPPQCNADTGLVAECVLVKERRRGSEEVEGGSRPTWDSIPAGSVCVCVCFEGVCKLQQCALPALLAGEKASALSCQYGAAPMTPVRCFFSLSSFFLPLFLLLSLQKPLPCPPLCPLCRQKAGITAPPQQVRCYFVLSDASIWGEIFW